jgi:hypothetical protein
MNETAKQKQKTKNYTPLNWIIEPIVNEKVAM